MKVILIPTPQPLSGIINSSSLFSSEWNIRTYKLPFNPSNRFFHRLYNECGECAIKDYYEPRDRCHCVMIAIPKSKSWDTIEQKLDELTQKILDAHKLIELNDMIKKEA